MLVLGLSLLLLLLVIGLCLCLLPYRWLTCSICGGSGSSTAKRMATR